MKFEKYEAPSVEILVFGEESIICESVEPQFIRGNSGYENAGSEDYNNATILS